MSQPAQSILAKLQSAAPAKPVKSSDLAWETMDISTLPDDMQSMFRDLLAIQEAERQARKALSDAISDKLDLPPHLTVRIACKWGKLSVAIDKAPSNGGSSTLADLAKRVR